MIKQPKGIVKLTNSSLVKYKVKGRIYELICFKNKIMDWRNGTEQDIENVLQISEIFTDAIKGEKATKEQLNKHFPAMTKDLIITLILEKGMTQISDLEREHMKSTNIQELIHLLSYKVVHPVSKRRFSEDVLGQAIKLIGFNPNQVRLQKSLRFTLRYNEQRDYIKQNGSKRIIRYLIILKINFRLKFLNQERIGLIFQLKISKDQILKPNYCKIENKLSFNQLIWLIIPRNKIIKKIVKINLLLNEQKLLFQIQFRKNKPFKRVNKNNQIYNQDKQFSLVKQQKPVHNAHKQILKILKILKNIYNLIGINLI